MANNKLTKPRSKRRGDNAISGARTPVIRLVTA